MTRDEIRQAVLSALTTVAPDVDPQKVGPNDAFRQELELDSMDFLNFVVGLHEQLGVDVPERDYARLGTLTDAVEYLSGRLAH